MLRVKIETKLENFLLRADLVAESEIVVLFGPSGTGKSTILKSIAGLMSPQQGEILLHGRTLFSSSKGIDLKPQLRKVGYVVQDYALFPHMTVEENVGYGLLNKDRKEHKQSRVDIMQKIQDMLETMNIANLKDRYPEQLSGGEKQRVALARALILEPELLLLDEPLSALDTDLREKLQKELYALQKQWNIPFVMVTHDRQEVERMQARKAILNIAGGVHEFTCTIANRPNTLSVRVNY